MTAAGVTTEVQQQARERAIVVSAKDLQVHFPTQDRRGTVKAVDGVTFDVRQGETFGIIGESGSGKTTIGRALVLLQQSTGGEIRLQGIEPRSISSRELRKLRRDHQIIFQDPNAALNPRMTILASIMEPSEIAGGMSANERRQAALKAMEHVGLGPDLGRRYPHQLSGGQKQRVLIARALTLQPKVIVCDEVVAALDMSIRGDVLNLFAKLQREFGLTYVFITHDLSVVSHISDRVAVMYLGRFAELGPAEAVTGHALHPYTQALLSAEPLALPSAMRVESRIVLEGEIPSPMNPPSGCRFRTRCPYAQQRCADEAPAWREALPDHWVACHYAGEVGLKPKP